MNGNCFTGWKKSQKKSKPEPTYWGYGGSGPVQLAHEICRQLYGLNIARQVFQGFKHRYHANIQDDGFDLILDLSDFNRGYVRPFLDTGDDDLYDTDNSPTGHGDECYSDADSGM